MMISPMLRAVIPCLILVAACATGNDSLEARRTTLDGLPPPVAATIRDHAGTNEVKIEKEHHRGGEVYEASWWVDGAAHEATVTPDGTLIELEESVAADQVPTAVRAAAAAALPGATRLRYVRLMSHDYEVEAVIDGKEHEVVVSPTGQRVREGDDDDDDGGDDDHEAHED